ncbi:3'-5' exonuclease domain-containing protein 2 [Halosquirtibacter laminarini]|uniref:3'-5' exonuclease domain-containing protein 2 n=1 Tax=Halosquirtibacter laminarini TaxID=3374600 RepID=A0AC61NPS4_9BACT|nr:3'-5' exonuclease domain-containing protein 2 [Prolixibacteraceae bacterium]
MIFFEGKKSISKEELASLPLDAYNGEIILVDTKEGLEEICLGLQQYSILGFDTETRPAFKKGVVHEVSLLQLSTDDQVFLFRLNKIGLPSCLKRVLENKKIVKVGAAIRDDIKGLNRIGAFNPGGFVELQDFVKEYEIENFGLKKLAGLVLGFRISKGQRLTNWENDVLTPSQQIYAATDAWVSSEVYKKLISVR